MARILVVDDDKAVRLLLRAMLERRGHSVVEAENGDEGLRYYRAAPTDLVITDIQMPVMDGLQMIKELRGAFPTAKIIAISGEKGRLAAAQTFSLCTFEKPLYMKEFLDAVQQCASAPGHSLSAAAQYSRYGPQRPRGRVSHRAWPRSFICAGCSADAVRS